MRCRFKCSEKTVRVLLISQKCEKKSIMIKPTKCGVIFIVLMGLLYLSSMQSQSGLLFFIIGILFGCFILNIYFATRSLKQIEIEFPFAIKMMENEKSRIGVGVKNLSKSPQGMVEVSSTYGKILRVGVLPGQEQVHLFPEVSFSTRGVYSYSKFKITSFFPFGLISVSKKVRKTGEFIVLPKVYPCLSPPAGGFEPMLGGVFTGKHKSVSGSNFAGIRPFTPDDSFKFIHWKSSSKGMGLMVKEFSEELSGRITVIMDRTASEPDKEGETVLDAAVRAVGSITLSALDIGHHVDIVPVNSGDITHFPPFADGTALLEMLARMEAEKASPTLESLRNAVDLASKRSAVCFVMTSKNEALQNIVKQLIDEKRKVSILLPIGMEEGFDLPAGIKISRFDRNSIIYES